ncbi:MAG: diguanylate cyclase [Bacillales bacterium]|nr:diguanylate cyclase [Bacillales bacterium]
MSIKLRTYFAITIAGLIIVLSLILSVVIGKKSSEKLQDEVGNSLSEAAFQMSDKLDHFMWSRYSEVMILSELDTLQNRENPGEIRRLLNQLNESIPSFSWVGITSNEGRVIASTGGILEGADVRSRPVYIEGMKRTFIGDVHDAVLLAKLLPNPSGEPLQFVDISTPILDNNGKSLGVLAAHLSWEWSKEMRESVLKPLEGKRKDVEIFIVSSKDNTVLLGPEKMVGKPLNIDSVKLAQSHKNDFKIEKWPDGKSYVSGYAFGKGYKNYPGLGWTVIVRQPEATAFSTVKDLQETIMLLGTISAIIFAFIGWLLAGRITSPLNSISNTAKKLISGEETEIQIHKGIKEVEILSSSIRELVTTLGRKETELGVMETKATHDNLTGLPNRAALFNYVDEAMVKAKSDGDSLVFLYLDLDGFKGVNDTHGHHIGDLLLQEVGRRLSKVVAGQFVSRLGGDEFVIVLKLPAIQSHMTGKNIAGEIISAINEDFYLEGKFANVGCSIGIAVWPLDGGTVEEILKKADKALYVSKSSGKNRLTLSSVI